MFLLVLVCGGGHSLIAEFAQSVPVETITLDDFALENGIQRIDFLKMDCEGAEYDIFFNASKSVLGMIQKISMEYHDLDLSRNHEALQIFLRTHGFNVYIKSSETSKVGMLYACR